MLLSLPPSLCPLACNFSIVWSWMPNIYIFIAITHIDFTNVTLLATSGTFCRALVFKNQQHSRSQLERVQTLTLFVFLSPARE